MSQRASGFRAAKGCGESEHTEREKNGCEQKQDGDGMKDVAQVDGAEKRSAHGVERIGDGIQAGDHLQPVRKNGYGEQHAAGDAGDSKQEPLGGIAALEEKQIAGGQNTEARKSQERNE